MPDRYRVSDLHELRDAIESAVRPPAPAQLASVAVSRRRTRLAVSAVAGVVLIAALAASPAAMERADAPASVPTAPTSTQPNSPTPPAMTPSVLPPIQSSELATLSTPSPARDGTVAAWGRSDLVDHPESQILWNVDASFSPYRLATVRQDDSDGWIVAWHRCGDRPATPNLFDCDERRRAVAFEIRGDNVTVDPLFLKAGATAGIGELVDARYVGDGMFYLSSWAADSALLVEAGWEAPRRLARATTTIHPTPGLVTVPCFWPDRGAGACVLDVPSGTLTPVDLPRYEVAIWSSQNGAGFWGVARHDWQWGHGDRIVVQRLDGAFDELVLAGFDTYLVPSNVPEGMMAVFAQSKGTPDRAGGGHLPVLDTLHVSENLGRTWRAYLVPEGVRRSLDQYLPELPLDWERWGRS